jgi:hypothetical protein
MKPLVELMGELRERRQERGEPRSHAPDAQEGVEHDGDTLRSWSGDADRRHQEGVRRPWWRRVFGG